MRRPNRLEVRKLHQDRRHEHAQRPIGKILAFIRNMDQVCPTFSCFFLFFGNAKVPPSFAFVHHDSAWRR